MFNSPFILYLFHLTALSTICGRRSPYTRLYVGSLLSFIGICSSIDRYAIPDVVVAYTLDFLMAFFIVDFLFIVDNAGTAAIQRIAGLIVCRDLQNVPDRMHVPIMGLYAVSQTYYMMGAITPTLFVKRIYCLLHGVCSIALPLWYIVSTPMTIYVCGIHILLLTQAVYEFGRII